MSALAGADESEPSAIDGTIVPINPNAPEVLTSLFVVSDLHCVGNDRADHSRDSLIRVPRADGLRRCPMESLKRLVEKESIDSDHLVCCGDLTNRAGKDGFVAGWHHLEHIADQLKSKSLIFSPGNHDIDVLNLNSQNDLRSCLNSVTPLLGLRPARETEHRLETDRFEVYRDAPDVRIINLDSNGPNPSEFQGRRGTVPVDTIDAIESTLNSVETTSATILVCHHHPYRHGDIDLDDYSEMDHAPELLTMIERVPDTFWLIIHGHKHYPRIIKLRTNVILFSAGSIAGTFRGVLQTKSRNQCYYLQVLRDPTLGPDHSPVGVFRSWDWGGVDWIDALDGFNIPCAGGFGATVSVHESVSAIATYVLGTNLRRVNAADVFSRLPHLKYLLPGDIEKCADELLAQHNIDITVQRKTGAWRELGLRS